MDWKQIIAEIQRHGQMTQAQIAAAVECGQATISDLAKGSTKQPNYAHVVLTIRPDSTLILSAYRLGVWNTTYANAQDSVIDEIPALVNELREELAAIKAQG